MRPKYKFSQELKALIATDGDTGPEGLSAARGCVPPVSTFNPPSPQSVPSQSHHLPPGKVCPASAGMTSNPISIHEHRNLFIQVVSKLGVEYAVRGVISAADAAYSRRELERVSELGQLLTRSRLSSRMAAIGSYYIGLANVRTDYGKAIRELESAIRLAPPAFQSRALLSLATVAGLQDEIRTQREILFKLREAPDLYTRLEAIRASAIALSTHHGSKDALSVLSSFAPVALQSKNLRLHWANGLAVEYLRSGNLEAAKYYLSLALASPLARFYEEVGETARDIAEASKRPETVSVAIHKPADILPFMDKAKAHRDECERRWHRREINLLLDGFNLTQTIEVKVHCRKIRGTMKARASK